MAEKRCNKCDKPLENKRRKYCSESCKYWYNTIKRDEEKHLPPVKKRTNKYFMMIVGSEWAKGQSRQGKRSGSMVTGSMAAMVRCTVEEVVLITKENLERHFKGIPGCKPNYIRLGDGTTILKEDIEKTTGIKIKLDDYK